MNSHASIDRRAALRRLGHLGTGVLAGLGAAHPALAAALAAAAGAPSTFGNRWLRPFKGVDDGDPATSDLRCASLAVSGRWPAELRGRFYRNGPAVFERAGIRYRHWFDGDGMVQQFTFDGRRVSHLGRLVRTTKLLAERDAGRFLYSAFGTGIASPVPTQGPDSFNAANTSAIEHAGRVLAMWEGGSAYALDPAGLETLGPVTWQEGFEQMPFSAHPKLDPQTGALWNIGTAGDRIVVWHVDARGRLVRAQVRASPHPNGMAHDVAVTARYLVLPLPPLTTDFAAIARGASFEEAFRFAADQPLRILVMSKNDIADARLSSCRRGCSFTSATRTRRATARSRSASSPRRSRLPRPWQRGAARRPAGAVVRLAPAPGAARHGERQGDDALGRRRHRVPARRPAPRRRASALPGRRRDLEGAAGRPRRPVPRHPDDRPRHQTFDDLLGHCRKSINEIPCDVPDCILPANRPFAAYLMLRKVFQTATKKVELFDPYMEPTVWHQYLWEIDPTVEIVLVTGKNSLGSNNWQRRDRIVAVSTLFHKERPATYSLLKTDKLHDRHLRIDESQIYHLGGSVMDAAASNPFSCSEMDSTPAIEQELADSYTGAEEWIGRRSQRTEQRRLNTNENLPQLVGRTGKAHSDRFQRLVAQRNSVLEPICFDSEYRVWCQEHGGSTCRVGGYQLWNRIPHT